MKQLKITKQITTRESESLDKYLNEIGKVELVSPDEEVKLARRIREGDQLALEKLTRANLRFVVSVAKQYQNRGLSLNDLINEGNLGLIKAGQRFDETRGFKFISYAVWWIRQSIMHAIAQQSRAVRLPWNRVGSINRLSRAFAELEQKFQREPTVEELAEELHTTVGNVTQDLSISTRTLSMSAPIVQGEDGTLLDMLYDEHAQAPDAALEASGLKTEILRVLATLTLREAEVLTLYYGLNGNEARTLEEIGLKLSITRERVRQIKETATRRLRHSVSSAILKSFFC